jgi:hypothetical protein
LTWLCVFVCMCVCVCQDDCPLYTPEELVQVFAEVLRKQSTKRRCVRR